MQKGKRSLYVPSHASMINLPRPIEESPRRGWINTTCSAAMYLIAFTTVNINNGPALRMLVAADAGKRQDDMAAWPRMWLSQGLSGMAQRVETSWHPSNQIR